MTIPEDAVIKIQTALNEAIRDIELEPHETAAILAFANREIPSLFTPEPTYLVLGSYRHPLLRRVRIVEHELNRRIGSRAFLLGDLPEIEADRLPTFRIRFYLIATLATSIVAVFEQDGGGEVTELGKLSETPFFDLSYVLPRDYHWMTARKLDSKESVITAAIAIHGSDLTDDEIREELQTICTEADENGIAVSMDELRDAIDERQDDGPDPIQYSWVQLNEFRLFELHDRCYPWSTVEDLRIAVERIP
ncbi:MAG: hypothetical protein U5K37_09990 [Natrialbaceae archaeon]|nr:hypothetical protein [Natrialbaceae archaeon]